LTIDFNTSHSMQVRFCGLLLPGSLLFPVLNNGNQQTSKAPLESQKQVPAYSQALRRIRGVV